MQHYRIEFLDNANMVVRVMNAKAGSPANAFLLVVETDWPPGARQLGAASCFPSWRLKVGSGQVSTQSARLDALGGVPVASIYPQVVIVPERAMIRECVKSGLGAPRRREDAGAQANRRQEGNCDPGRLARSQGRHREARGGAWSRRVDGLGRRAPSADRCRVVGHAQCLPTEAPRHRVSCLSRPGVQ